jgi:sigma-B regulation protein RsbU (phosphoserine phosphatase)
MSKKEYDVGLSKEVRENYKRLEEENRRLRKAVDELAVLNDMALAISGSLDSEKIMRSIIGRSIRAIGAEQGDITLIDANEDNPSHTLVRSMVSSSARNPLSLNQNLLGWMQINKKPLLINAPRNDDRFKNVEWEESVESVLCAPLMAKSNLIGILTIYNKKDEEGFTESDKRLLSILAAQVVENARLYEEEQEYKMVQREMEFASGIQKKLLPSTPPEIPGYSLGGRNITAKSVGGDYFDYMQVNEHSWAVCLGDISGKGLPASLLMSNLQAILRGQIHHLDTPAAILNTANVQLYHSTSPEKFATIFLGILNTEKHTLQFSSGGHEYPFLVKVNGECSRLQANGVPLGIVDGFEYPQETIELEPGDCIFVFSDGVTESMGEDEEEFGEKRLEEMLISAGQDRYDPDKLIDKIFNASIDHSGRKQLFDDMTSLVISRKP